MATTQVIYNLVAKDNASKTFDKVGQSSGRLESGMGKLGGVMKAAALGVGGVVAAMVPMVKAAADFQVQMTRVHTGAGELASNMKLVSNGILEMAGQVGESTTALSSALYTVESAGYHGADALNVLKVSAMGARVGAADLPTVVDAVTTALNAYGGKASDVTRVMNALVATEGEGKTNMEQLAGSLSTVLPAAAAAHVGLNDVLGAMATMTAQGTPAKVAATYLRQTIGALSGPTQKASNEMESLGLNATQVGLTLGHKGLGAALDLLTDAIERHMGPAGIVLIDKLKSASTNATSFQKILADLPPNAQTYVGALADMVGGTKSMQAALELGGTHADAFAKNVDGIAAHVAKGGNAVEGWADVQQNFNQRLDEAKDSLGALGIKIGTYALPVLTKLMGYIGGTAIPAVEHLASEIKTTLAPAFDVIGAGISGLGGHTTLSKGALGTIQNDAAKIRTVFGNAFNGVKTDIVDKLTGIDFSKVKTQFTKSAKSWAGALIDGVKDGVSKGNWGPLGDTVGKGIAKAAEGALGLAGKLASIIGKAFGKVDWVGLGIDLGKQAPSLLVGLAAGLLNFNLGGLLKGMAKHWQDVLLGIITLAFAPAKWIGKLGEMLTKIPLVGSLLKWGLDALVKFSKGLVIKLPKAVFTPLLKGIVDGLDTFFPGIAKAFDGGIGGFFETIALKGMYLLDAGKTWIVNLGKGFLSGVESFGEIIGQKLGYALSKLLDWGGALVNYGVKLLTGLKNGIMTVARPIGTWIYNIAIKPLLDRFTGAAGWLWSKGADIVDGMKNGITSVARSISSWMSSHVISPITSKFSTAGSWLYSHGKNLISGLFNGIADRIAGVSKWIKTNVVDPVVNAVKHWFGIHSPSTVFAELGGHLTSGLMLGMARRGGTAIAKHVFGDLPSALLALLDKGLVSVGSLPGKALKALSGLGGKAVNLLGNLFGGGNNSATQQIGETLAAAYGWSGANWSALKALWNGESGWNTFALNKSSGAYGIPQSLPADKMASAGADWKTNPATQIKWGLSYIKERYGDPLTAYKDWLGRSPHWYDHGGVLSPGTSVVHNGLSRSETIAVFTPEQWQALRAIAAGNQNQAPQQVRVYIGDRELTDLIDVRVDHGQQQLTAALNAGEGWR